MTTFVSTQNQRSLHKADPPFSVFYTQVHNSTHTHQGSGGPVSDLPLGERKGAAFVERLNTNTEL